MSYRTGHQILVLMMQDVADRSVPPSRVTPDVLERAIERYTGRRISVSAQTLAHHFDAMQCVRERKYRAGAAPERVREHLDAGRGNLDEDRQLVAARVVNVEAARNRLDAAFAELEQSHGL